MEYTVLIQYDAIDKIYIAQIPELQGCFAHGKTQLEALTEISAVFDMWMEEAKINGRQIPDPELYAGVV